MKAYITSIGEPTTDLCRWSLERLGFETELILNKSSLWEKLKYIFDNAQDDFIRVDADVVVNKNILELVKQDELWWYQSLCYGWFAQDVIHGGIQYIRRQCFPAIREHIEEARRLERPESYLSRLAEFHDPRVFGTFEKICGIHGYKQADHLNRVKEVKLRRGVYSNYDFELADRLEKL